MRPIQYKPAEYQPLPGIMQPIPIREFRGVNTFDSLSIADSYFTDMSNLSTDDYPAISVRPGYSILGGAIGTKVLGLGTWKDQELHAVFNDGTWRKWTGSAWTTLKSGLDTSADWSFTNFQGNLAGVNLIGCNGVNGLHRYDGSTVQTFGNAAANINFITTYQNRLWGASGAELLASMLDDPAAWQTFPGLESDSYGKQIESSKGETINMLSGSLTKLTIGMPNGVQELFGGVPSDFATRLVTDSVGMSNNKSAITVDGITRFIHKTGIYDYGGSTLPDHTFSDIVGKYLTAVSSSSVAGANGQKLYFRIGSDILAYDSRAGVNAWSVWKGISAAQFVVMKNDLYIGDEQGRVLKLGGSSDAGTPISWYAITKPFTNGSIAQRSRWLKMWIIVELAAGSTLNVELSPSVSGNDWSPMSIDTTEPRVLIPVSEFALENYVRILLSGTGWARIHEITRQTRQLPLY